MRLPPEVRQAQRRADRHLDSNRCYLYLWRGMI
jgi:hypothetical protein